MIVGELVTALRTLGREDAADILLSGCSLYRISGPAGHVGHVSHVGHLGHDDHDGHDGHDGAEADLYREVPV